MLLRFGVRNHRSIRDYEELLLSASKRIKREGLVMPAPTLREAVVPVAAIYGANAAGKSNLIDALYEFRRTIVNSHKALDAADRIPRNPFLLGDATRASPTQFDCTFTLGKREAGEIAPDEYEEVYEYGFEYTAAEFKREWLYRTVRKTRQSTQVLFERVTDDGQTDVSFGNQLRGENRIIARLTRPNSLFLSATAQNNHPQLTELYRYFVERWKVIFEAEDRDDRTVAERLHNYEHVERLLMLVQQADIGIVGLDVEEDESDDLQVEIAKGVAELLSGVVGADDESRSVTDHVLDTFRRRKRLRLKHSAIGGVARSFDYHLESKGTRALISLLIPALDALSSGSLLVVDELDTSIHPDLASAFVSLFNKKESNPHGAQIVFSTHDVTLLGSGLLRQDQIWMADKDREGASRFTPLTELKLRSRDDIEKAYRHGRLGGVPSGGDFILSIKRKSSTKKP